MRRRATLVAIERDYVEASMEPLFFEDYAPGMSYRTFARTLTETDVVNFVALSGMYEPLFVDQEYLRRETPYTGRLVPGALTYAIAEGLVLQTGVLHDRGIAFLGLELQITKPVYVGDTIHVEVETLETQPTRRDDRGIVVTRHHVCNQRDEEVMNCKVTRMLRRRPHDGGEARPPSA